MPNLQSLKIPIFQGINDIPRAPSAELGGNGSHMVKAFNDLIDRLNVLTEVWDDESNFYIHTVSGNDSNSGVSSSSQMRTLGALVNKIQTKKLPANITIFVTGTLSGTIDFSEVWGDYKGSNETVQNWTTLAKRATY